MVAVGMRPRPKRRADRSIGHRQMVRKGRGEIAPPDRLKPPTWRAWKARTAASIGMALSTHGRVGHGVARLPPAQPGAVRPA